LKEEATERGEVPSKVIIRKKSMTTRGGAAGSGRRKFRKRGGLGEACRNPTST